MDDNVVKGTVGGMCRRFDRISIPIGCGLEGGVVRSITPPAAQ
jgi:hypothetical protein